jgi:hypothetical protein
MLKISLKISGDDHQQINDLLLSLKKLKGIEIQIQEIEEDNIIQNLSQNLRQLNLIRMFEKEDNLNVNS